MKSSSSDILDSKNTAMSMRDSAKHWSDVSEKLFKMVSSIDNI